MYGFTIEIYGFTQSLHTFLAHLVMLQLCAMEVIIKLVKMWSGGTPHVVVGTLKISLD